MCTKTVGGHISGVSPYIKQIEFRPENFIIFDRFREERSLKRDRVKEVAMYMSTILYMHYY